MPSVSGLTSCLVYASSSWRELGTWRQYDGFPAAVESDSRECFSKTTIKDRQPLSTLLSCTPNHPLSLNPGNDLTPLSAPHLEIFLISIKVTLQCSKHWTVPSSVFPSALSVTLEWRWRLRRQSGSRHYTLEPSTHDQQQNGFSPTRRHFLISSEDVETVQKHISRLAAASHQFHGLHLISAREKQSLVIERSVRLQWLRWTHAWIWLSLL